MSSGTLNPTHSPPYNCYYYYYYIIVVIIIVTVFVCQVIHETETITFVDLSRPASVDVEDDGPVSVRDALVFLNFANFATPHALPQYVTRGSRRRYLSPQLPRPGKLVNVRVCHVNSPDDFYIQLVCTTTDLYIL